MSLIQNLVLQRRDGKLITEDMKPGAIGRLGWKVDKVVAARWTFQGQDRRLDHQGTLAVKIVSGRNFLAVIATAEADPGTSRLMTVNPDGSIRTVISNEQTIAGEVVTGSFSWMENSIPDRPDHVAGIFRHPNDDMFRIDIDVVAGAVLTIGKAR